MGADPLTSIAIAVVTFVIVTGLVTRLLGLVVLGVQALFGWREARVA